MEIECEIEGIRPLLMHRFEENDETEPKTRPRAGVPKWEAAVEDAKYVDDKGRLVQPSTHIEGALIKAATNFQIPGRRKKTYKDLIKAALIVEPELILHKMQKYIVDKRGVVIPSTGGRVMRYRPRLNSWKLGFTIILEDEQLQAEAVKEILNYAGKYVGIGDFRPKFGRFVVTKFKEVKA